MKLTEAISKKTYRSREGEAYSHTDALRKAFDKHALQIFDGMNRYLMSEYGRRLNPMNNPDHELILLNVLFPIVVAEIGDLMHAADEDGALGELFDWETSGR